MVKANVPELKEVSGQCIESGTGRAEERGSDSASRQRRVRRQVILVLEQQVARYREMSSFHASICRSLSYVSVTSTELAQSFLPATEKEWYLFTLETP
jgi:hypothetical protein